MQKSAAPVMPPSPGRKALWGSFIAVSVAGSCAAALGTGMMDCGMASDGASHAAVNMPLPSGERGRAGCAVTILPPGSFCGVQTEKKDPACPSGRSWEGRAVLVDPEGFRRFRAKDCVP